MPQTDPALTEWLTLPEEQRRSMMQASEFANQVALSRVGAGSKHNAEYQLVLALLRAHLSASPR